LCAKRRNPDDLDIAIWVRADRNSISEPSCRRAGRRTWRTWYVTDSLGVRSARYVGSRWVCDGIDMVDL